MHFGLRHFLLTGTALVALSGPAFAAGKDATQAKIDALQRSVADLDAQLQQLRDAQAGADSAVALGDLKRSTSDQYVDLNNQIAAIEKGKTKVGLDNGRLTFASPDGRFTLSLRSLVQYDVGYFSQGRNPAGVDLNSGSNFRRAQFGFVGTAFSDWAYNFTYDFGGNGTEKSGYIYSAYLEYDGFKPVGLRIGAYAPPAGLEDSTGSAGLIFLERPSASDIARNIAGSPSRDAITLFAQGDRYLAAISYTGGKVGDAATFDEQQAVVGRLAALAVDTSDVHWLVDADFTHVFKLADAAANSNANTISFSNGPELAIDANKTVNTGNIAASTVTQWGLESGISIDQFYGQGGYFHYDVGRFASALPDPHFDGWYAAATWSLTGESHAYNASTASFSGLKPVHPLGGDGWGALEVKARYSNINLNYAPLAGVGAGAVTGGVQDVWSVGLNWYPTSGIRFALDYENIKVSHANAPATDISSDAVALRTQLSL